MGVLICGDLFDESLVRRMRALRPRWLWVPMARAVPSRVELLSWWEEEQRIYARQIRKIGAWGFPVNLLDPDPEDAFGGSFWVHPTGRVMESFPPLRSSMHAVEMGDFPGA